MKSRARQVPGTNESAAAVDAVGVRSAAAANADGKEWLQVAGMEAVLHSMSNALGWYTV